MPKTIRNEYDKYLTFENLMKAHKKSRKGKNYRENIIKFNLKQEEYIMYLYNELKNLTYKHGKYREFYVKEPKLRKIEASKYIDRVVHTWYVESFLKNTFMKQFLPTSYACVEEKGMHRAALDVQKGMVKCKNKYGEYYILKMDVTKFFPSINKDILFNIMKRKIKDKKVLWLTKEIIYSTGNGEGIPIGNYTSQIFANIYLNEVDQYIKNILKVKLYYRYMDDSIILVETKEEAKYILEKIEIFLNEKLKLNLNSKTNIFKSKQGVNFCGYKINEYRMKIRSKGKKKIKRKINFLKNEIKYKRMTSKDAKKYLCGHFGYIKYANCYNLINKLFEIED